MYTNIVKSNPEELFIQITDLRRFNLFWCPGSSWNSMMSHSEYYMLI